MFININQLCKQKQAKPAREHPCQVPLSLAHKTLEKMLKMCKSSWAMIRSAWCIQKKKDWNSGKDLTYEDHGPNHGIDNSSMLGTSYFWLPVLVVMTKIFSLGQILDYSVTDLSHHILFKVAWFQKKLHDWSKCSNGFLRSLIKILSYIYGGGRFWNGGDNWGTLMKTTTIGNQPDTFLYTKKFPNWDSN